MGGTASKLGRRVTTRYNVETRAQKFIEKQKVSAKPPPKFHSTEEMLKTVEKNHPGLKSQLAMKDSALDENLKKIRIESFGPAPEVKSMKKLPQDRTTLDDPEFGHLEPAVIPKGKLSIQQLMEGLEKSMLTPEYTHVEFAHEYNLDLNQAHNVFYYFKPYTLYTDLDKETKEAMKELPKDERKKYLDRLKTAKPALKSGNE